jgi:hypothetical protein
MTSIPVASASAHLADSNDAGLVVGTMKRSSRLSSTMPRLTADGAGDQTT